MRHLSVFPRSESPGPTFVRPPAEITSSTAPVPTMNSELQLAVTNDTERSFGIAITLRGLVCNMATDGLAHEAGVQLGDTIVSFNGSPIKSEAELFAAMNAVPHGHACEFVVARKTPVPENSV